MFRWRRQGETASWLLLILRNISISVGAHNVATDCIGFFQRRRNTPTARGHTQNGLLHGVPKIAAKLEPTAVRAFALLAAERKSIEAIPEVERAAEVGRSIRFAYLRRRQNPPRGGGARSSQSSGRRFGWIRQSPRRLESIAAARPVVRTCPLAPQLGPAVLAGDSGGVERILQDFGGQVERSRAERRSLDSLASLRGWMKDAWISEREQRIRSGDSNVEILRNLKLAMPTLKAFQVFRAVRQFIVNSLPGLPRLGSVRPSLQAASDEAGGGLAETVRRRSDAKHCWAGRVGFRRDTRAARRRSRNRRARSLRSVNSTKSCVISTESV